MLGRQTNYGNCKILPPLGIVLFCEEMVLIREHHHRQRRFIYYATHIKGRKDERMLRSRQMKRIKLIHVRLFVLQIYDWNSGVSNQFTAQITYRHPHRLNDSVILSTHSRNINTMLWISFSSALFRRTHRHHTIHSLFLIFHLTPPTK